MDRELSDDEKADLARIKELGQEAYEAIGNLEKRYGSKRDYSLAKTKIEEAVMWAVKGLTE